MIDRYKRYLHYGYFLGLLGILSLLFGGFVYFVYIKTVATPEEDHYLGSAACQSCHQNTYMSWSNSLHPKMMRRVTEPGVVVAKLSETHPDILFHPSEAVWAIGSKWEQQFMGQKNGQETLLPGAWLIDAQHWQQKNWDGWDVPVPLERCHGCHTVGLDVETGHFVEPSIGCESCHGPSAWHAETTWGMGQVFSSLDAQICGQCHTRGRSTNGIHFFPVNYRPDKPLAGYFVEMEPHLGENTSYWWGNGRERKRHQQYYAWRQGGHVDSLKTLTDDYDGRFGKIDSECLTCHAGEAAIMGPGHGFELDDVKYGITCAVCHNAHGDLDKPRIDCSGCHRDGAFYHSPERNANHVACPPEADVGCVGCHMPLTGRNGGAYTLHSHWPGVIPPQDTQTFGVPNSCGNGGCHSDRESEWQQAQYEAYYLLNDHAE